jgi:hypothetical protein
MIRFENENRDTIEIKKTRSDRKKLNRFALTITAGLRAESGSGAGFSIAI